MGRAINVKYGLNWDTISRRDTFEWIYLWFVDIDQYKTGQDIIRFAKQMQALEGVRDKFQKHYEKVVHERLAINNMWPVRQRQFLQMVEQELQHTPRTPQNIQGILSKPRFFNEINNITKLRREVALLGSAVDQGGNQIDLINRRISYFRTIISALDEHLTRIQINSMTEDAANVSVEDILDSVIDVQFETQNQEKALEEMGKTLQNFMKATRVNDDQNKEEIVKFNEEIITAILNTGTPKLTN